MFVCFFLLNRSLERASVSAWSDGIVREGRKERSGVVISPGQFDPFPVSFVINCRGQRSPGSSYLSGSHLAEHWSSVKSSSWSDILQCAVIQRKTFTFMLPGVGWFIYLFNTGFIFFPPQEVSHLPFQVRSDLRLRVGVEDGGLPFCSLIMSFVSGRNHDVRCEMKLGS